MKPDLDTPTIYTTPLQSEIVGSLQDGFTVRFTMQAMLPVLAMFDPQARLWWEFQKITAHWYLKGDDGP